MNPSSPKTYFHLRAVAVVVHHGQILVHQASHDQHWSLPGGHVELGEAAADALQREMLEELDCPVQVGRLLWVVENFWQQGDQHNHEIGMYFRVYLPAASPILAQEGDFHGIEQSLGEHASLAQVAQLSREELAHRLTFRWFACQPQVLKEINLLPAFLQAGLPRLPRGTRHVVVKEE